MGARPAISCFRLHADVKDTWDLLSCSRGTHERADDALVGALHPLRAFAVGVSGHETPAMR